MNSKARTILIIVGLVLFVVGLGGWIMWRHQAPQNANNNQSTESAFQTQMEAAAKDIDFTVYTLPSSYRISSRLIKGEPPALELITSVQAEGAVADIFQHELNQASYFAPFTDSTCDEQTKTYTTPANGSVRAETYPCERLGTTKDNEPIFVVGPTEKPNGYYITKNKTRIIVEATSQQPITTDKLTTVFNDLQPTDVDQLEFYEHNF